MESKEPKDGNAREERTDQSKESKHFEQFEQIVPEKEKLSHQQRDKTKENTSLDNQKRFLNQLKDHIVQIESLIVYLIICTVVLFLISNLKDTKVTRYLVWFMPLLFLIFLRSILRVTNPSNSIRNSLTWASVFGGMGGAIAGAIADIFTGGLTAGHGSLIGLVIGASIGGSLGDRIEHIGKDKKLLERGEAFNYIYNYKEKVETLSSPQEILKALDENIPYYDINDDGRKWYSTHEIKEHIKFCIELFNPAKRADKNSDK